jgi:tetratricopeptide (TPR) repeat protein
VWTDLGNCICLADPARSVPIYQQALSVGPPPDQAARAYANLGNAYLALHRRDDAIASFGRALQLDPSSGYARQGLAAARALNP